MKGLIKTSLVIVAIIAVGGVTTIIISSNLIDKLAAANEYGYDEGYTLGYEIGLYEGSRVGYQEGSKVGYAKSNEGDDDSSRSPGFYFVYNPTYDEVYKILAESKQSSALKIHDYAEANGIRTAYVRVPIARQAAEGMVYVYELVAFETVDKGLIIIEPWSHREVKVEVGKHYHELNGLPLSSFDDTITEVTIVW